MNKLLAVDPANIESGYVVIDTKTYIPLHIGKVDNYILLGIIEGDSDIKFDRVVIEDVASYGMSVGKTTFDTCKWIGRFIQQLSNERIPYELMNRQQVKKQINTTLPKGEKVTNDASINAYLHNRFAPNTPNKGKGRKGEEGFFYGFKADIWQAMALGVAYLDKEGGKDGD